MLSIFTAQVIEVGRLRRLTGILRCCLYNSHAQGLTGTGRCSLCNICAQGWNKKKISSEDKKHVCFLNPPHMVAVFFGGSQLSASCIARTDGAPNINPPCLHIT